MSLSLSRSLSLAGWFILPGILHGRPQNLHGLRTHHQSAPLQEADGPDGRELRGSRRRHWWIPVLHRYSNPPPSHIVMLMIGGCVEWTSWVCFCFHVSAHCSERGDGELQGDAGGDLRASASHHYGRWNGGGHLLHQPEGEASGSLCLLLEQQGGIQNKMQIFRLVFH